MLEPMLNTDNPLRAATQFTLAGWKLDFYNPPESGSPLCGVSLCQNQLLLCGPSRRCPDPENSDCAPGVIFNLYVPFNRLEAIHASHLCLHPTALKTQPWGDVSFDCVIAGYRFTILANPNK